MKTSKRDRVASGFSARRLLAAVAASGAVALFAVACAETPDFVVAPGGGGAGAVDTPTTCADGLSVCGDGCCGEGFTCSSAFTCIPSTPCEDSNDCTGDSACGNGSCVSWNNVPLERRFDRTCREQVELEAVRPEVQCRWPAEGTTPSQFPESVQVIGTPMVVDFDFDGDRNDIQPSIVFVSYESTLGDAGILRVIDGEDCSLQASISNYPFMPIVAPALGDLNGDGRPEIVVADELTGSGDRGLSVWSPSAEGVGFEELGNRRRSSANLSIQGIAIHDLDGAQPPEVLTQVSLFAFDPREGLIELDQMQQRDQSLEPPIVVDINRDQRAEMVTSKGIMMWDTEETQIKSLTRDAGGSAVWNAMNDVEGLFLGLADFGEFQTTLPGGDDLVEMVIVEQAGDLIVSRVDGGALLRVAGGGRGGGPPVIADLDGDGRMEFAVPSAQLLTIYDLDCATSESLRDEDNCGGGSVSPNRDAVMWKTPTNQIRGARAGAAVFDFDGDGGAELVHADQCYLRVFDGVSGEVLFSAPRMSTTRWEYPVVADVDGDSYSEIVTASNVNDDSINCPATDPLNDNAEVAFDAVPGVTVWKDQNDRWMGSRPVWNQHNYFVTNVNDDGTIPTMGEVVNHWETRDGGPNTFRRNTQGVTGSSLQRSDLTTFTYPEITCEGNRPQVLTYLCNRGLDPIAVNQGEVAMLAAANNEVLCTKSNATELTSGKCELISCGLPASSSPYDVTVMSDPRSQVQECWEGNNGSTVFGVFCGGVIQ